MRIGRLGALTLLLAACTQPNAVDTAFGGSQVFDGGEFTLAIPKGWRIEKSPIQNVPELLMIAKPDTEPVALFLQRTDVPGGPPQMLQAEATLAYLAFRLSMIESAKGYDSKIERDIAIEKVGKSIGYTAAFSFSNSAGKHLCEFAGIYKQPKYYVLLVDTVGRGIDPAKLKAVYDTFIFK